MKTGLKLCTGTISLIVAVLAGSCSSSNSSSPASNPTTNIINPVLPPTTVSSYTGAAASAPSIVYQAPSTINGSGSSALIPSAVSAQSQSAGIWVTGEGDVAVIPDVATVSIGVDAQALTVADAQQQASGAMSAIMAVLKSNGIADQDITTQNYSIYPVYSYGKNTPTLIGYHVSNTLSVNIRNIGNAGKIIDAVVAAGGNYTQINNISFTLSDPTASLQKARQAALADAIAKATQLATGSGVKLGAPIYISEATTSYVPPTIYYPRYAAGAAAPSSVATTINPGQTQVSVTVQMGFGIG